MYDKVYEYPNCTVQILKDSETGAVSMGWWENTNPPVNVKSYKDSNDEDINNLGFGDSNMKPTTNDEIDAIVRVLKEKINIKEGAKDENKN